MQLLECALKLFAQKGYHSTTVADIVREAGVARGTFYLYYNNKRDIFQKLLENNFSYIFRTLPDLKVTKEMDIDQLREALLFSLRKLLAHRNSRDFINLMLEGASGADKELSEKVEHFYQTITNIFCSYVARAQALEKAKKTDPYLLARFIVGVLKEAFYLWSRQEINNLDQLANELLDFVMFGIRGSESEAIKPE